MKLLGLYLALVAAQPAGEVAPPAEAVAAPPAATVAAPSAPAAEAAPSAPTAEAATTLAIDPTAIVGDPAGPPLTGEALRARTHAVSKLMRCPVCQGLSVADSPSESALAMKKEVEDLVAKGYDDEQILTYFEASYGEFVRLEPKFEGLNLLVWGAPLLLVLGGGAWIAWTVRKNRPNASSRAPTPSAEAASAASAEALGSPATVPPPSDAATDPALAAYLARVREETR